MLYAFLCYNDEAIVESWTKEHDDSVMAALDLVHQKLSAQGRLGPSVRLMPTTTATFLRKSDPSRGDEPLVIDGPFAETKEQLLGFYIIDCDSLEHALDVARDLARANPGAGGYEIRPLRLFQQRALER